MISGSGGSFRCWRWGAGGGVGCREAGMGRPRRRSPAGGCRGSVTGRWRAAGGWGGGGGLGRGQLRGGGGRLCRPTRRTSWPTQRAGRWLGPAAVVRPWPSRAAQTAPPAAASAPTGRAAPRSAAGRPSTDLAVEVGGVVDAPPGGALLGLPVGAADSRGRRRPMATDAGGGGTASVGGHASGAGEQFPAPPDVEVRQPGTERGEGVGLLAHPSDGDAHDRRLLPSGVPARPRRTGWPLAPDYAPWLPAGGGAGAGPASWVVPPVPPPPRAPSLSGEAPRSGATGGWP